MRIPPTTHTHAHALILIVRFAAQSLMGALADSPLRSVAWRVFLGVLPEESMTMWPAALAAARAECVRLRYYVGSS